MLHKMSRIFQPKITVPIGKERNKEIASISRKLLADLGFINSTSCGTNVLLPLTVRSLEKLKKILKFELEMIGAQEIVIPILIPITLLKKTKRHNLPELFKLTDRNNKDYVLGPTHEESITNLMTNWGRPSYKHFPLFLYQIGDKFRDEMKPKSGLIRSREFLMKDLYTFDISPESAQNSYELVKQCYTKFFNLLKIPYVCVSGDSGEIGGSQSQEFHIVSEIGEDKITICDGCNFKEKFLNDVEPKSCPNCNSSNIFVKSGIEVAHSFLLGTKYSQALDAVYTGSDKKLRPLHMTCHGIGLTRLLAAAVEVLSTDDELRWPEALAPFSICIIPPKSGSKEEATTLNINEFQHNLSSAFPNEVVVDDRLDLTIGKRIKEAKQMGFPCIIVIGKSSLENPPKIEIHEVSANRTYEICSLDALSELRKNFNKK